MTENNIYQHIWVWKIGAGFREGLVASLFKKNIYIFSTYNEKETYVQMLIKDKVCTH